MQDCKCEEFCLCIKPLDKMVIQEHIWRQNRYDKDDEHEWKILTYKYKENKNAEGV